eukprot:s31_g25.t1
MPVTRSEDSNTEPNSSFAFGKKRLGADRSMRLWGSWDFVDPRFASSRASRVVESLLGCAPFVTRPGFSRSPRPESERNHPRFMGLSFLVHQFANMTAVSENTGRARDWTHSVSSTTVDQVAW